MLASETIRHAIDRGGALLATAGIDAPRGEARLLLAHALGCQTEELLREPDRTVSTTAYNALLHRRAQREPLALILGYREFWSLRFAVSPATLIPRPESETLLEAALRLFADRSAPLRILDLGTGTGCLLLASLHEFPRAFGVGIDRALAAVKLARDNASNLGLADRSAFACADWAQPISARFDLILSNPPYIESAAIPELMPEVARYEPRSALDGGADGLEAYRRLIPAIPELLRPAGVAILEIGVKQAAAVAGLAKIQGMTTWCGTDLAGIPRVVIFRNTLP
jgi:release factor glutamine methyltransferase